LTDTHKFELTLAIDDDHRAAALLDPATHEHATTNQRAHRYPTRQVSAIAGHHRCEGIPTPASFAERDIDVTAAA
jgi:hypothetical protein